MDDRSLVTRFEDCTLPPAELRHREHVQLAWLYLLGTTFEAAGMRFCTNLRRYTASLGKADRYHETITWAYLALVHERMQAEPPHPDFASFAEANPDLFDRAGGALAACYDEATLASAAARRAFRLPRRSAARAVRPTSESDHPSASPDARSTRHPQPPPPPDAPFIQPPSGSVAPSG